jgi:hypothetical protein
MRKIEKLKRSFHGKKLKQTSEKIFQIICRRKNRLNLNKQRPTEIIKRPTKTNKSPIQTNKRPTKTNKRPTETN